MSRLRILVRELGSDRIFRAAVALPLLGMALGGVVGLLTHSYVATSRILPDDGGQQPSDLTGLAAQFGIPVGAGFTRSPEFYAELLSMRSVREELVEAGICRDGSPRQDCDRVSLWDALDVDSADTRTARNKLHRELRRRISARAQPRVGLVEIQTRGREPWLAEALNGALLDQLQVFDLQKRQLQAVAQRRFLSGRVAAYQSELASVEDSLRIFLERNRVIDAPGLQFEHGRYERKVALISQVLGTITESYERARIEEVRTTPVFTVVEEPWAGAEREGGVVKTAGVGFSLGLALALAVLLVARVLPPHLESVLALLRGAG